MSFTSLLEILMNRSIALVKVSSWDDPYENFFLKSLINARGKEFSFIEDQTHMYGCCWTLSCETDAMWRIYSSENVGLKIKSTAIKLFNPFISYELGFKSMMINIGKVKYYLKDEIEVILKDLEYFKSFPLNIARLIMSTQFLKRDSFEHEKELRLIMFNKDLDAPFYNLKIDPFDFIEEICFDPRISNRFYEVYKKTLLTLGYKGTICKSEMYSNDRLSISFPHL